MVLGDRDRPRGPHVDDAAIADHHGVIAEHDFAFHGHDVHVLEDHGRILSAELRQQGEERDEEFQRRGRGAGERVRGQGKS